MDSVWVTEEEFLEDRIAVMTLNNPGRRNALSGEMLRQLAIGLREVGRRESVNVVVIRATGSVFSAGHDLREILGQDGTSVRALFESCADVMGLIRHLPQIVVAQVAGIATAAGCQLVAAADLAVAGESARFATPGVKIGYFCASPSVQVARNVPLKKAAEMLFTGQFMSASDALQAGLVNRVVADHQLEEATWALAREVSQWSLPVLRAGKEFLYRQVEMAEAGAAGYAVEYMTRQSPTADAVEGMTAFFEKRPPRWSDRAGGAAS